MTLEQLAGKTRLSVSFLSQLERDRMTSSLAALKRIAEALKVPAGSLMFSRSEAAPRSLVDVVPARGRKRLVFPGSHIRYEMLTPDLRRRASLLWLEAPAGADSGAGAFSHEGEDAVVVLQGRLEIEIGGVWHRVGKGDSIYFSSELPHRWRNPGRTRAVAIWMSTPPSF
jgi:transcriptional regulator with XRE-family HTH domain